MFYIKITIIKIKPEMQNNNQEFTLIYIQTEIE